MSEDIDYWHDLVPKLALEISKNRGQVIDEDFVWRAIQILCYEKFDADGLQVYGLQIPYEELIDYFKDYDFSYNAVFFESSVGDLHYSLIQRNRAQLRNNGKMWIVHKYDQDPFPSKPHAHDLDNNLKLHLGNGFMFRKKEYVGKLPYKEFIEIREKLQDKGFTLT